MAMKLSSRFVPTTHLEPGDVFAYPTAAHGQVTVAWQRDGVVMSTENWLLDLRRSRAVQLWEPIEETGQPPCTCTWINSNFRDTTTCATHGIPSEVDPVVAAAHRDYEQKGGWR